ncbi:type II toxin-antitoxin system RatA family toxin [Magnetococcales bacterium HHB-1]
MKTRTRTKVPYTPQQMYDLVVDMDSYPQFIPWCIQASKSDVKSDRFLAHMTVAFKGIRETFTTLDRVIPGKRVDIELKKGPFKHLKSTWVFEPMKKSSGTQIDFIIDFKFKSKLLDLTMGPVFYQATKKMVAAFTQRAHDLYKE